MAMRRFNYHVITPFSRVANLNLMLDMLSPMGINWHLVYEEQHKPELTTAVTRWVRSSQCPAPPPGWFPGNWKLNWLLDQFPWDLEARYIMLSDDDFYEPGFFDRMDAAGDGDVLICSMKRGDRTPGTPGMPAYDTSTLVACPANLGCGGIGGQQIMMSGWAYRRYRLGPGYTGDWDMISGVLKCYVPTFVPDAFVWFNYLEPGRWNGEKVPG